MKTKARCSILLAAAALLGWGALRLQAQPASAKAPSTSAGARSRCRRGPLMASGASSIGTKANGDSSNKMSE